MARTALYVRVSSEEQALHGLSIEAQTQALKDWCEKNHASIVGCYVDAGISARKKADNRPALQQLLTDVRAGRVDLIIFTKLDRWFRNISEYYKVQEVLEACHVNWKTIHEDYDTSTASGRLKINIMLSVAQDEADRTGERIKAVFESKLLRQEPVSGKVPLGYRIENKHMVLDPDTAPIAQDIFTAYLSLRSIRALRQYIMEKHHMVYCHTAIKMLLQNERYIGRAHEQSDFCPALISPDVFYQVQSVLQVRAQRTVHSPSPRIYLFTGLVFCAECGNRLSAHVVGQKYIYYRCTRYEKLHLCPHKKRTSELVLEKWLLENMIPQFTEYNMALSKLRQSHQPMDTSKIRAKMEKLKDLYLNDLIERDVYERDYTALRDALREADLPPAPLPAPVDIEKLENTISMYSSFSRTEKKEFWNRTISKILITQNEELSVFPV